MSSMPVVIDKWRETTGKYAITLHSCIPVTDKEKINEQKKSIGTGSLYVQTKLGVNRIFLQKDMADLNPKGYRTL